MPLTPVWLIESEVFGETSEPVKQAIRSQGLEYCVVHARQFLNGLVPDVNRRRLSSKECVIFWGSPPLMKHLRIHYPNWRPGGWCNFSAFDVEVYYHHLNGLLLNSDSFIGEIDEIMNNEKLFSRFQSDSKVFVRPTCLEKVFTGRCVNRDELRNTLTSGRYAKCRVLVAKPQTLRREWRVIMHRDVPLSASQYLENGRLQPAIGCPQDVLDYAAAAFKGCESYPDELFVVDIGEVVTSMGSPHLKIIELNSFSCSGWYQADANIIVRTASELATRDSVEST